MLNEQTALIAVVALHLLPTLAAAAALVASVVALIVSFNTRTNTAKPNTVSEKPEKKPYGLPQAGCITKTTIYKPSDKKFKRKEKK